MQAIVDEGICTKEPREVTKIATNTLRNGSGGVMRINKGTSC